MSADFDRLDSSLDNSSNDQDEELTLRVFLPDSIPFSVVLQPMEIDVAAATPSITNMRTNQRKKMMQMTLDR